MKSTVSFKSSRVCSPTLSNTDTLTWDQVGRRVLFCSRCRVLVGGESPEGWMEVGRVKGCGGRGSCQRRWCKWMWGVAEGGKPKTWIVIEGSCQTCFTKRKHLPRMLSVLVSRFLEQYKKRRQNVTDYQPGNQHLLNVLWLLNVFVSEPPTKSKKQNPCALYTDVRT